VFASEYAIPSEICELMVAQLFEFASRHGCNRIFSCEGLSRDMEV